MPPLRGQSEHNDRSGPRQGNARRPISCMPCRHRKLRCDRAVPACGNCVNRGDITACCYAAPKPHGRSKAQEAADLSKPAQDRIERLEQLVITLLNSQQRKSSPDDSPPAQRGISNVESCHQVDAGYCGKGYSQGHNANESRAASLEESTGIKINADYKQAHAVDEAHWALLLKEIGEVRSYLTAQHKQYEDQKRKVSQFYRQGAEDPGPGLLFGSAKNVSRSDILSQLPSRYSCDIIITRFFAHLYPAIYILHGPTFLKEYEAFWSDQGDTSVVWIAMLFAMLRIAMLDYIRENDEPPEFQGKCRDMSTNFRNNFTDCLILADYTQPHEFLIEALILHLYAEYVTSRDARSTIWVLNGMVVRLAMRLGYHQPSQPTLNSSPFKAEMRRRAWAFVRQADIITSFQIGLPSMIRISSLEESMPRNIYDDENFHEDCKTLPDALPDSEPTQISFLIAKTKLVFGFARSLKEINRTETMKWERILEIDRELRNIYDNIPDHYKLGPLSSRDSLTLLSARFVLSSIHHKSLCVVHSRFLEVAKSNDRYSYSRRVCLSSAMAILRFQAIQNQDIPVDGRLRSLTNYQTSLTIHDYLLAATIISTDLCSTTFAEGTANDNQSQGMPSRSEMIKALSHCAQIFGQMRDRSVEAYKAADILSMLVKKLEARDCTATRNPKEPQKIQNTRSAWMRGNASTPSHDSSRERTSPPSLTSPFAKSSTNSIEGGIDVSMSQTRPQHTIPTPSRVRQSLQADRMASEMTGSLPIANLDFLSTWPETQDGDYVAQTPVFPLTFPDFETSAGLMLPEHPDFTAPQIIDNDDSGGMGHAGLAPYTTTLALSDPVSALWSLNSDTRMDWS